MDPGPALQQRTDRPQNRKMNSQGMKGAESSSPLLCDSCQSPGRAMQFLGALQRDERRLFQDRLRQVDRHVMPGLSKMTWNRPKAVLDQYFNDALWCGQAHAAVVAAVVWCCPVVPDKQSRHG